MLLSIELIPESGIIMKYGHYRNVIWVLIMSVTIALGESHFTHENARSISQDTIEILHGIFTLKSKFSEINKYIEDRMNHLEEIINQNTESESNIILQKIQFFAESLEIYRQTAQEYVQELALVKSQAENSEKSKILEYQQEAIRQCEELQNNIEALNTFMQQRSIEYMDLLNRSIATNQEKRSENQQIIIDALNYATHYLSKLILDNQDIYADNLRGIQQQQCLQQEECCTQIIQIISAMTESINESIHTLDNQEQLFAIMESISALSAQWRAGIQENIEFNNQSYLGLLTRIVDQEVMINKLNDAIQHIEKMLQANFDRSSAQQELILRIALLDIEKSIIESIEAQSANSTRSTEQCCAAICQQMYAMQSALVGYLDDIKSIVESYYIEQITKVSAQLTLLDEDIAMKSNQLQQKMDDITISIERNATIIQAQLAAIEADISHEIIQGISDLNTELQISTNTVLSAVSQSRTVLSNELSSKLSNVEATLVRQNNALYSKISAIDCSIKNDVILGINGIQTQLTEYDINTSSALSVMESDIISNVVTSVSNALTDLTLQNNKLCSKIAVAQADLTAIAAELDTHTCDMTEQHAAICSKISETEKRIVDEIAALNLNVSNTGFQIIKQITIFAVEVGQLIRRSTAALNTGIVFIIDLLTKMYISPPVV